MGFVAITNGSPGGNQAVVELAHGGVLACTATVIAPHALLTAAHCLAGAPGVRIAGTTAPALASFAHPAFDPTTLDHDIAVMLIDPVSIAPLPYALSLDASVGDTFQIIGYGLTMAGDTSPALLREGTARITAIDPLVLRSAAAPAQTCEGDSGGPAVHAGQIIGVASSGDAMCAAGAVHTRVDVHADFIAATVAATAPGGAQPGDRCYYAANCAAGACMRAADDPRVSFCATSCADGCAAGLVCDHDLCVHPLPSPGTTGAACRTTHDCVDGLCISAAGSSVTTCTTHCFDDLPGSTCPDGTMCVDAADGGQACFAPAPSSGCSTADPGGWIVGWLALGLTAISRRSSAASRGRRAGSRASASSRAARACGRSTSDC